MATDMNSAGMAYPLTKMNFLVSIPDLAGSMAAFSEVTGIEASVDVVEFRQGNAHSLALRQIRRSSHRRTQPLQAITSLFRLYQQRSSIFLLRP